MPKCRWGVLHKPVGVASNLANCKPLKASAIFTPTPTPTPTSALRDAGAWSTRTGRHHALARRTRKSSSSTKHIAPKVMALSAMLKLGK